MMASGDRAMTLATETSRHDEKPVVMADPSKENNLAMTTAFTAAATRISIALHAAVMTKGKAPAALTMIQLHEE
jgi:L-aminopeptidase/D-esterase-like protein